MASTEEISGRLLGEKEQLLSPSAYLLWYKSLLGSAGPEGKALFFTSSSGLGIPFYFSRWLQQQQTELVLLLQTHPVIPSVQPKQPSHYWLQLFGTGNLIPVPHWRPICEVVWWKSLPPSLALVLLYPANSLIDLWLTKEEGRGGVDWNVIFSLLCWPECREKYTQCNLSTLLE